MPADPTSVLNPQTPDLPGLCLAITEHAPLPIASVEGATHIVRYVNPAFCHLMGKTPQELIGQQLSDLLPAKDICVSLLERVYKMGKPESYTEQDPSKPHPVFWSYTMWPVIADKLLVGVMIQVTETAEFHGKTIAINEALLLGSLRQHELTEAAEALNTQLQKEIAERKQVETFLRESEERYRNLFDSIDEGFCVIDMIFEGEKAVDYRFLEVNPSFEQQSGLRSAVGKRIRELVPDLEEHWFKMYGQVALTGEPVRFANESREMDRWFDVYAFRIGGTESRKVAVLFSNVTEQKRTEHALKKTKEQLDQHAENLEHEVANRTTQLRDSIKSLESLTYTMAHDLRAPIRAMKSLTHALMEDVPLNEEGKNYAEKINKAAGRMDQLVNDLLDYGQLTHLNFPLHPVDLKIQIEKVISETAREIQKADATIRLQEPLPPVSGNETLLKQVFSNLILNALKFVAPGMKPEIVLSAERRGSMVRIRIVDNGIGIAPEHQDKIFGVFQRLHTTEEFGGTGVGLAIVKRAVERMGGSVGVESAAGQGSRFWIELPGA
jgi:PAS domain S-box-containing protein